MDNQRPCQDNQQHRKIDAVYYNALVSMGLDWKLTESKLQKIEKMILEEFRYKYVVNNEKEICKACELMIGMLYEKVYGVGVENAL